MPELNNSLAGHALHKMLDARISVTLGTDNRTVSHSKQLLRALFLMQRSIENTRVCLSPQRILFKSILWLLTTSICLLSI